MKCYSKGAHLYSEHVFMGMQAISSRKNTLCCVICMTHIGGWEKQANFVTFQGKRKRETIRLECISSGLCLGCVNYHCDEVFCSSKCLQLGIRNGHLLECGVDVSTICDLQGKSVECIGLTGLKDMNSSGASAEFRRHSMSTDELFLCARRVIVTLAAPFICSVCPDSSLSVNSVKNAVDLFHRFFPSSPMTAYLNDDTDDDGTLHESWLLLSSSLLQSGVDQTVMSPLMSYGFYRHLVRDLLPRHVKYLKCEGAEGRNPLQMRLLDVCRDNECDRWIQNPVETGNNTQMLSSVAMKLFPSAFNLSRLSLQDDSNSCPSGRVSSCPALTLMAAITSAGSMEDEDDGGSALEALSCTCLVLLPHTARFAKHSCLPTAHVFVNSHRESTPTPDGHPLLSLHEEGNYSCDKPICEDEGEAHDSDLLPSSTLLEVSVEAERDFTCNCVSSQQIYPTPLANEDMELKSWWKGMCVCSGQCCDGLSISLLSEPVPNDTHTRNGLLRGHVPETSDQGDSVSAINCECVRCKIESRICADHILHITEQDNLATLLALAYLYMQSSQHKQARSLLSAIAEAQEQRQRDRKDETKSTSKDEVDIGEIYHALGGSHLAEGNWRAACHTWRSALANRHFDCPNKLALALDSKQLVVDESTLYSPLCAELAKLDAYPTYRASMGNLQKGIMRDADIVQVIVVQDFSHELSQTSPAHSINSCSSSAHGVIDNAIISCADVSILQNSYDVISLSHSNYAYLTAPASPLLSLDECRKVIALAKEYTQHSENGWTTNRHYAVPTTDFPVHHCAPILEWFNGIMQSKIVPLLATQLASERKYGEKSFSATIHVHDAFVVKYDSGVPLRNTSLSDSTPDHNKIQLTQKLLPLHFDESTHSFVISLNGHPTEECEEGFEGGGTYFHAIQRVICPGAGHMLSFAGGRSLHGGAPVSRGVRYILAVFLYVATSDVEHTTVDDGVKRHRMDSCVRDGMTSSNESTSKKLKMIDFGESSKAEHSFSFQF